MKIWSENKIFYINHHNIHPYYSFFLCQSMFYKKSQINRQVDRIGDMRKLTHTMQIPSANRTNKKHK